MRLLPLLLAIVMAAPVAAQHAHSATGHDMGAPQETGQSAFAALAEIVDKVPDTGLVRNTTSHEAVSARGTDAEKIRGYESRV